MLRLRRGSRPRVYLVEPSPGWCMAILRVNNVEVIAKRISDNEVSVDKYIGDAAEAELVRIIV